MSTFTDYLADALNSYIAGEDEIHDLILRQGDDDLIYADVEEGTMYLITVHEAVAIRKAEKR